MPGPTAGTRLSARELEARPTRSILALQCSWIVALSFQYGFHISVLNGMLPALSPTFQRFTRYQLGQVTSIYALGGLFGSIVAGMLANRLGRKHTCTLAAALVGTGTTVMACSAPYFSILMCGRLVIGFGCGIAVVVVPNYLSEIAPPEKKGSVGVLNQLGIVVGIFLGQSASLGLATPTRWRYALFISAIVAAVQILSSPAMIDSPVWLAGRDSIQREDGESSRLLDENTSPGDEPVQNSQAPPKTFLGVFTSSLTRKGLRIVLLTQTVQQASGINTVLFYSTEILGKVLPTNAGYVALMITAVNLVMTFPPMYFIDRVGRRPLLLSSIASMSVSALLLSFTINSHAILASIFIMAFVASFSLGLGPIPFILISEAVPAASAPIVGSIGLALNWITNSLVAAAFIPLDHAIGTSGLMLLFAAITGAATILLGAVYRS